MAQPIEEERQAIEERQDERQNNDDEVANDDEHEEEPAEPVECQNCKAWYKRWLECNGTFGEIFRSPYYFAMAFFALGALFQVSIPLLNWYTIWLLLTQTLLTATFGGTCFVLGACMTAQYELMSSIANLWASSTGLPSSILFIKDRPHRM